MTIDELNILHKKSETRKDGIYSFRGNLWVVKSNRFVAYINYKGEFLRRMGAFNIGISNFSNIERSKWKQKIKEMIHLL